MLNSVVDSQKEKQITSLTPNIICQNDEGKDFNKNKEGK
jgi:hypothetical protein